MCGIAGYVCNDEYKAELDVMFPLMGVFMQTRGVHSWGYTDWVNIDKHVGALDDSFGTEHRGAKQAAIHTRHATEGAKVADNSHPWEFDGKLIGMHNGIVYNHKELNKDLGRNFEVDSMHIFQHIIEGRDLSDIEGYGAIVYQSEGKIWLGRFNGGDMCVARAPWGIVYASTQDAIDNAFRIAGLPEPVYYQINDGVLYFIENGLLYKTDNKLNISRGYVATKWSDVDWKDWQGGSWLDEQGSLTEYKAGGLTEQTDLPSLTLTGTCEECTEPFQKGDNRNYTRDGWLCDECAEYAAEELMDYEAGQHIHITTVRKWLGEQGVPPTESDMLMLSCDRCTETLLADDTVCVLGNGRTAEELYCAACNAFYSQGYQRTLEAIN